jgi:ATP-dependent RNA helicase DOB1
VEQEDEVIEYYGLRQQLGQIPLYLVPFLDRGRLVRVESEEYNFGWGIVVDCKKERSVSPDLAPDEINVVSVLIKVSKSNNNVLSALKPVQAGRVYEIRIVLCYFNMIKEISSRHVHVLKDLAPFKN